MRDNRRDILLIEYQKAQDSAEHHERLGWQARNILWLANITLLGFTFTKKLPPATIGIIGGLGVLLLLFSLGWDRLLGATKKIKYERCREIEGLLGMKQHLCTDKEYWKFDKTKCYCRRPYKKKWLAVVLTILLMLVWGLRIAAPHFLVLKDLFALVRLE